MAEQTKKERKTLGTILLCISAFTGVMSIVFLIKFFFFSGVELYMQHMTAVAAAVMMLYGTFMGIGLNYTIRVPRGKDDDRSQVIAAIILMILGVIICASLHIIIGEGEYIILPIAFYAQNWLMLLVALYSLKFYKR